MTRVCFSDSPPGVVAVGHADYGKKGEDIVCASLSTLMFTLPAALKRCHIPMRFVSGDGYFMARALPAPSQRKSAETVFATVRAMVEILARQYPGNIRVQ